MSFVIQIKNKVFKNLKLVFKNIFCPNQDAEKEEETGKKGEKTDTTSSNEEKRRVPPLKISLGTEIWRQAEFKWI